MTLWDMAGDPEFRDQINKYYTQKDVVIVVYDCMNQQSFDSIGNYLDEARFLQHKNGEDEANILYYVVANKCDKDIRDD